MPAYFSKYKKEKSFGLTRKNKIGGSMSVIMKSGKRRTVKPKKNKPATKKVSIKKQVKLLTTICSDSGECMALGREINTIHNFFNGFTDFQFVEPPIKQIGKVSNNGFVKEIKYTREGYSSYAVLKSAIKEKSDNLAYEYQVGQYMNKQCDRFPCFLQTYALYHYSNTSSWKTMRDNAEITKNVLGTLLKKENNVYYGNACQNSRYLGLLIQHVNNAITLESLLLNPIYPEFVNTELPFILFQVYFPLFVLLDSFTHYDLHLENVLIYTLNKRRCIEYHYHFKNGREISFKSRYIAKIIDYGRSFFEDKEFNINSLDIRKKLCKLKLCKPNCGENYGFGWLSDDMTEEYYFIDSTQKNNSHDLRLLNEMKKSGIDRSVVNHFRYLFDALVYEGDYGTEPMESGYPTTIQNIKDVILFFMDSIDVDPSIYSNMENAYDGFKKIGDIHVYEDNLPMQFIPVNDGRGS
jgi:hypothetical protein